MTSYELILSPERADKVAARSDAAGYIDDLRYLNDLVEEMIDSWDEELPSWL